MQNRRDWLQSIVAIAASMKARYSYSAPTRQRSAHLPSSPQWESLLKLNRIQPVVARSAGVPTYGFGAVNIFGQPPDLVPSAPLQAGNRLPFSKIRLKKSWEIKNNKIGATPPRTPRTWMMDFKPLREIHLIDGNPDTYWCSRGQTRPTVQPQWIRIDLPREVKVKNVVIIPRADNEGWPRELKIEVSRDAWHWETVYEGYKLQPPPEGKPQVFTFAPRPLKQVRVTANNLRTAIAESFIVFSVAGVEVHDEDGNNVALSSRGAGVTVSSTNHGAAGEKSLEDMLWPVHYDLGLKWVRLAYWDSVLNWHYAEQARGEIVIDPLADQTVTEMAENGINVILCLAYGNWLYSRGATQKKNAEAMPLYSTASKQIWVVPFEWPPPPTETEEYFNAWLQFVRAMVHHFKGRIRHFEIWNEENVNWYACYKKSSSTEEAIDQYCRLAKRTARVIRGEYPDAKILLGSVAGFDRKYMTACLESGLGPLVDVIAWHPFYGTPQNLPKFRNYPDEVRAWKKVCESYGFKGEYMATESGWYAPYPPPAKPFGGGVVSEIVKAKCLARYFTMSVGLDLTTFWNTTWHHYIWWDLGLFRNPFSAAPISPTQPQAAYYVLRNLGTLLESVAPVSLSLRFSDKDHEFESVTFQLANGDRLIAVWLLQEPVDESPVVTTDIDLDGIEFSDAFGIDVLNGTAQSLTTHQRRLQGMLIKDYPVFIRLKGVQAS